MTTPHEEKWTTGEGALSGALYSGDTWIGSFTNPERARLAREAPEMMRALILARRSLLGDVSPGKAVGAIQDVMLATGIPFDTVLASDAETEE